MDWPVDVALARPVQQIPDGPWAYEIKLDGHRTVLWRTADGVRLQSRSGRDVTAAWGDLAAAGMALEPGTVLDGEAVIYMVDDQGQARISFEAAQSRAHSAPARARDLAGTYPATYVPFDILARPAPGHSDDLVDLRARPYEERRQHLLDVLADIGPPIEPVWSTTDREQALGWYEALRGTGVEGLVCKPLRSTYQPGRRAGWLKARHTDTVDAEIVGYTGPPRRPHTLAVQLPDGRIALSQRLDATLATVVAPRLVATAGRAETAAGDLYTPVARGTVVEVAAGTTRHPVVTVLRVRS
ncbi:DNA ligase [Streptomyces sp. NPDC047315]|uniref:ATP-dependent DNA ligase n=1 Tax=Streptomyces sp. NPDC047315 TaxID=3155142 RepID=UPI0033DE4DFF